MTISRRSLLGGAAGAVALGAAGCSRPGTAGTSGERQLRLALEGPPGTSQELGANIFKESLETASGGAFKLATYPGAQLGGEPELLQKIRTGDIDFIISSTANAAQIAPQSGVMSLHYLMPDKDMVQAVIADDAVNTAYREMVTKHVRGAQALTLFTLPLRNFYAKSHEVHSVKDLHGLKIRVQATKTEDFIFAKYGAQTVHLPFPELYTSLQTGVVNMAENALDYYGLNKHYEVAPVMSMTEHEGNCQVIWASDKFWQSLSDKEKGFVTEAASKVRATQPAKAFELEAGMQQKYAGLGVRFVKDVDKQSFQSISVPLQDQLAKQLGPDAVKILQAVRKVTGAN
jgi:TRAP-type C4-dicarboxylate transport system substrate-binding protein